MTPVPRSVPLSRELARAFALLALAALGILVILPSLLALAVATPR